MSRWAVQFVAVLVLAGCGSGQPSSSAVASVPAPSGTPGASETAEATPTPTPTPSPTPSPTLEPRVERPPLFTFALPPGFLPPFSRVVAVAPLAIRAEPGRNAALVATAPVGTILVVDSWFGPELVDGIHWTLISVDDKHFWAAAILDGTRYLDIAPPRCPGFEPDLATLTSITAWEQLACFGDRSLTIVGTYGCPICGDLVPGSYAPAWLALPSLISYLGSDSTSPRLVLHFSPQSGLEPPPNASIVRVTGHFSDPASTTCRIARPDHELNDPIDPPTAELYCRERFVVDAYEVIGSDPDFVYPPAP